MKRNNLAGWSALLFPLVMCGQTAPNIRDALTCPNTPDGRQPYRVNTVTSGHLRRVLLTAPDAVCNDGTPAAMYVRAARDGAMEPDGPSANRWIIHFLGGSNCSSYEECGTRWCGIGQWEGTLMTTRFDGDFRNVDGLLGRNSVNRLGDRNQVLLKYCSSDSWEGRKSNVVLRSETNPNDAYSLHFRGATIVDAALAALEQGVEGMPRLTTATDVLIGGDSAGAQGARTHLDRIASRLRAANPNVRVRGQFEAAFNVDLNGRQGAPPGDPRDPVYAVRSADFERIQVGLRDSLLDESCRAAHPSALYLCVDDGYVAMNHLTTPFFQIMDLQDRLMVDAITESYDFTAVQIAQALHDQLSALPNIRETAVERTSIAFTPGVAARNCGLHVTYGDDNGFLGKKLQVGPDAPAYSYYEVLWNWLNGQSPSLVIAPRPGAAPDPPPTDSICSARASFSPPLVTATASSASYDFDGPVAPESIVVTFGSNLAAATGIASTIPWPATLGGIQVAVTDSQSVTRNAPIYYVSPNQVMYLIPAGTALGQAVVAIGERRSTISVAPVAPAIYSASQDGKGVAAGAYVRVTAAGVRTDGLLFDASTRTATAVPAAAGDQVYLVLYGTGMRGGPATATVGSVPVPVAGPVAHGQYPGLDQINLGPLPLRIGYGRKPIVIRQGDALANVVTVTFRRP